jgi:flagellar L-ring protein precursor FlgH
MLGLILAVWAAGAPASTPKKKKAPQPTPLEQYINEATRPPSGPTPESSSGSLWNPSSQYTDLARDLKASQVNDLVTIVVAESASAVSTGASKTQRKSSLNSSVTALAGPTKATGALANLANLGSNAQLDGSGTTSRQTTLNTTVTARVVRVLPNGYLALEGKRQIFVNSEHQTVTVRGVARPADLATDNSVLSSRLAQMEVELDGKGVVADSIRRPFILYRLLMGLLPF